MKFIVKCEIEVEFDDFSTRRLNQRAQTEATRWIRETLGNEASFIPVYVEFDETGAHIESCSKKTKIKVRREKDC